MLFRPDNLVKCTNMKPFVTVIASSVTFILLTLLHTNWSLMKEESTLCMPYLH
jgi:hypothetical protein